MSDKTNKNLRSIKGTVVSDKMDKTIVVRVDRKKKHSKYLKYLNIFKKYKVHDPKNEAKLGDVVEFIGCKPFSKEKRWRLYNILRKAETSQIEDIAVEGEEEELERKKVDKEKRKEEQNQEQINNEESKEESVQENKEEQPEENNNQE